MKPKDRKTYATPEAFKRALEDRIRQTATARGLEMNRLRQTLIFDRFLARVSQEFGDSVIAKGGVVLELRLERARSTIDVDLSLRGNPENTLERLQAAARRELGDYLTFSVSDAPDGENTIEGDGVVYEGRRYRAEAQLAGRLYGASFGVDVAFGDALSGEPDIVQGSSFFDFVGVEPTRIRLYPRETHVAEKLHAYTLPRSRPNTRVKDLPDLALLAQSGPFVAHLLRDALERTFSTRGSHPLPASFPVAPLTWERPYAVLAAKNRLPWTNLDDVTRAAKEFLEPVLTGVPATRWLPESWSWGT